MVGAWKGFRIPVREKLELYKQNLWHKVIIFSFGYERSMVKVGAEVYHLGIGFAHNSGNSKHL